MARYVRIDRDGGLSSDKGLKHPWKFSWLEEEQNIEDLLATPSSKKVYYQDFLEKINKHGFAKCMIGIYGVTAFWNMWREDWKIWNAMLPPRSTGTRQIETNKLRTRKYRF